MASTGPLPGAQSWESHCLLHQGLIWGPQGPAQAVTWGPVCGCPHGSPQSSPVSPGPHSFRAAGVNFHRLRHVQKTRPPPSVLQGGDPPPTNPVPVSSRLTQGWVAVPSMCLQWRRWVLGEGACFISREKPHIDPHSRFSPRASSPAGYGSQGLAAGPRLRGPSKRLGWHPTWQWFSRSSGAWNETPLT